MKKQTLFGRFFSVMILVLTASFFAGCRGPAAPQIIPEYTVTFDVPEKFGPAPEKQTVKEGAFAEDPRYAIDVEEYDFDCWLDHSGNEYSFDTPVTGNITLYAAFKVHVWFERDGIILQKTPSSWVRMGSTINNNVGGDPEKRNDEGEDPYNFKGWKKDSDGTVVDGTYVITEPETFSAVFTQDYVVKFVAPHHVTNPSVQDVVKGEKATRPEDSGFVQGYRLKCWLDENENEYDFDTPVTKNITLTAKYEVKVTLNGNGGTFTGEKEVWFMEGESVEGKLPVPTRTSSYSSYDWDFVGWSISKTTDNFIETISGPVSLYARWIELYTVTFSVNANLCVPPESQKIRSGNKAVVPVISDMKKDGYRIEGWYNEDNTKFNFDTPVTKKITLTAKYEVKVTFDPNGGTFENPDFDGVWINEDSKFGDISIKAIQDGKLFRGWSLDPTASTIIYIQRNDIVSAPITLKAVWAEKNDIVEKQKSDFLMLMYMDGDNDLHNSLFIDMNEVEFGLSLVRNEDGSPKTLNGKTAKSVNVVALWDGWAESLKDSSDNFITKLGDESTHIYQLGADARNDVTGSLTLGANTVDLTDTADFILNHEVNMGDSATLTGFLNWAMERYEADNIILQFSNHGGGPRSGVSQYVTLEDGRRIKLSSTKERKSMCWDEDSDDDFLKTKDIPVALAAAGFNASNKLSMIIEDVCLGASIEEAYELRNSAEYLIASPNNIPGDGLSYIDLIVDMVINNTELDDLIYLGASIVDSYSKYYAMSKTEWNKIVTEYRLQGFNELETILYNQDVCTLTFMDLTKMENLKNKWNAIAELILNKNTYIYLKDGNICSSSVPGAKKTLYRDYLRDVVFTGFGPVSYQGTFTYLFDTGFSANRMYNIANSSGLLLWSDMRQVCINYINALQEVIIASWRDGYDPDNKTTWKDDKGIEHYYGLYNSLTDSSNTFYFPMGLTVSGARTNYIDQYQRPIQVAPTSFYRKDLAFGKDTAWGKVLELWFPSEPDN